MAEAAFADMLKDPELSGRFDLHKVDRDCNGVEKAIKVDKSDVAQQTKMGVMAREIVDAIMGQTFDERIHWIEAQRKVGNEQFKQEKYTEAIDEYMKCLVSLDFSSCSGYIDQTTELPKERDRHLDKSLWITREREIMAQIQMKVPVLNNMAQCMIRLSHHQRAIDLCDQVLQIDEKNAKATARKITCFMSLGQHEKAEKLLRFTANTIDTFRTGPPADIQTLVQTLDATRRELAAKKEDDKKFMQNVFKKSGALYEDKKDVEKPDPLRDAALAEERRLAQERMEEAEYLETLNTFHWLIYPWFKMIEVACDKVFGCKKKLDAENQKRRASVQAQQEERMKQQAKQIEEMKKAQTEFEKKLN